ARVPLVVGGQGKRVGAMIPGGRGILQAVQGRVQVGQGAGDGDAAAAVAVDGHQTRSRAQRQSAVADRQGHLFDAAGGVHVGGAQAVAGGGGEGEAGALLQGLGSRDDVDGGIVHGDDVDGGRGDGTRGSQVVGDGDADGAVGGVGVLGGVA